MLNKRKYLSILAAVLISTALPAFSFDLSLNQRGVLTVERSDFDGMTTVSVSPGLVRNKESRFAWPAPFELGLFWSQKVPEIVGLVVEMNGVTNITSLEAKIGDKVISYTTDNRLPNWHKNKLSNTVSTKLFALTQEQFRELMAADKAMLRVNGALVGYFHVETSSMDPIAKKGIAKAIPVIDSFFNTNPTATTPASADPLQTPAQP